MTKINCEIGVVRTGNLNDARELQDRLNDLAENGCIPVVMGAKTAVYAFDLEPLINAIADRVVEKLGENEPKPPTPKPDPPKPNPWPWGFLRKVINRTKKTDKRMRSVLDEAAQTAFNRWEKQSQRQ